MLNITSSVQNEFWFHVSNQNEIPIFGTINKSLDISLLLEILKHLPKTKSKDYLKQFIKNNPNTIDLLRTFVGVSNKRMYLELSYIFAKTKYNVTDKFNVFGKPLYELQKHSLSYFKRLLSNKDTKLANISAEIITQYLIEKQVLEILLLFKTKLTRSEIETIIEKLILPKEIQQAEAKLRGHGAEQQIANLLYQLNIPIIPKDRHINPMSSQDPNVSKDTFKISPKQKGQTYSFDLIVTTILQEPLAFLQGLIHTSDPGQYGVNKSDETVQVKQSLILSNKKYNTTKQHWGLVDGVGFSENKKDTIDKMLSEFDCFIQLKSLYKAALQLHKLGLVSIKAIQFDLNFYTKDEALAMFQKYGSADILCFTNNLPPKNAKWRKITAGKAFLYV